VNKTACSHKLINFNVNSMYTATTPHLHYPTLSILLYPHRVEETYSEIHPHQTYSRFPREKHNEEEAEQEILKNPQ
jgi:hypothetical protein